jgi:hypothetical protein
VLRAAAAAESTDGASAFASTDEVEERSITGDGEDEAGEDAAEEEEEEEEEEEARGAVVTATSIFDSDVDDTAE